MKKDMENSMVKIFIIKILDLVDKTLVLVAKKITVYKF